MLEAARELKNDKLAVTGVAIILVMLLVALLAAYLAPGDPNELDLANRLAPPSWEHLMGTDYVGRDYLSRVIHGTRVSLTLVAVVVAMEVLLGVSLGAIAGYLGGIADELLMRVVDILLAFPGLILALAMVGILGPSRMNLVIALAAVGWVTYARMARGSIFSVKERPFIEASRALGCTRIYIVVHHILPNVLSPMLVLATLNIGHTIISIASLSFLGLGVQPPTPEWGSMLNEGKPYMQTAPHLMIFPGLMVMLTVLAFNFLGDGVRDTLDPKLKEKVSL